tara:strand:+ start:92 stop:667 length:576 start_codon:yes stop_codon:yes gene_type:complete
MVTCKFLRFYILISIFICSLPIKAENQLINKQVSLLDFTLLKYELFINKNLQRLFGGGRLINPIISYENVEFRITYNEENNFEIEIFAYMNKARYTQQVKYIPKNKDCNTVRNKIFLNKIGYYFLSKKNNKTFNKDDLNEVMHNQIFNFLGLDKELKQKIIDQTNIAISIIHPKSVNSINCSGKINQIQLN